MDTGQQFPFDGVYTHSGGEIHLQIVDPGFPVDETRTNTTSLMGFVYTIDTPITHCGAVRHGYDTTVFTGVEHFQCPTFSQGPASDQENVFERGALNVPGAIFRQRNAYVPGLANSIIRQGYGIFRQSGNKIYGYFGQDCDEFNTLTATLKNGNTPLRVEELGSNGAGNRPDDAPSPV
ncbi:hypothetical protein [Sedimenticola sp.]|uniref:hypothetical protein n=1 Tax=Sedimenticola sp. TaxID=1940285 RepID=UPI003D11EE12